MADYNSRDYRENVFYHALATIARGHTNNGRPIGGENARQIARKALTKMGRGWPRHKDAWKEPKA